MGGIPSVTLTSAFEHGVTSFLLIALNATMYFTLLVVHSYFRWLVLLTLIYAIYCGYSGWARKAPFSKHHYRTRLIAVSVAHIQFVIGLTLYFISPLVRYFLDNMQAGMQQREIRFFGMEHIFMMTLAVTVLTIGSSKSKRYTTDRGKYKTMAIWFTIALLIILSSIPWSFSPLISRPLFRGL